MSPKKQNKAVAKKRERLKAQKGRMLPADEARPILCPWRICTVHRGRAPG